MAYCLVFRDSKSQKGILPFLNISSLFRSQFSQRKHRVKIVLHLVHTSYFFAQEQEKKLINTLIFSHLRRKISNRSQNRGLCGKMPILKANPKNGIKNKLNGKPQNPAPRPTN